jgi:hypothetical protein
MNITFANPLAPTAAELYRALTLSDLYRGEILQLLADVRRRVEAIPVFEITQ